MAKQKEERNKEFIKAWKEEGLTDKQLQEKFGLSPGGVKGLKARLRKKDPSLYQKSLIVNKTISPQVDKSTSPLVHKRATYYLNPETIKAIKQIALDRDLDTSALVREILNKYLKNK